MIVEVRLSVRAEKPSDACSSRASPDAYALPALSVTVEAGRTAYVEPGTSGSARTSVTVAPARRTAESAWPWPLVSAASATRVGAAVAEARAVTGSDWRVTGSSSMGSAVNSTTGSENSTVIALGAAPVEANESVRIVGGSLSIVGTVAASPPARAMSAAVMAVAGASGSAASAAAVGPAVIAMGSGPSASAAFCAAASTV